MKTTAKRLNLIRIFFGAILALAGIGTSAALAQWPAMTVSRDGTPIAYEVSGKGALTLVLIHGWSCDSRYWRAQVPYFAQTNQVVTLDLAGHGHSGSGRTDYTMRAFGEDVAAVVKAVQAPRVILIGHSMGGIVMAQAALLLPDQVLGLIGVDTLQNVEYPMTREELDQMTGPLNQDFQAGCRAFVAGMLRPLKDPRLSQWIMADMAAARPEVAMSAMNEMLGLYLQKEVAKLFDRVRVPVACVNADLWPVDQEANRRHMVSFDLSILEGTDHFLMMNRPQAFNPALAQAVARILEKQTH